MWTVKPFGFWAISPETGRAERQHGVTGVPSTVRAAGVNVMDGAVAGPSPKKPRDSEVAWVPFPGHKRNAPDDDIYSDAELGPGPAKLIAVDERYTDVVLAPGSAEKKTEMGWSGGDWRSFKGTLAGGEQTISQNIPPAADEEMQDDGGLGDAFAGANYKCLDSIDGSGTKKVHEIKEHGKDKMHDKAPYKDLRSCLDHVFGDNKLFPKLVVSEGLQNLLSREPSEDFALPRTWMTQSRTESTMAIVPWKPLLNSSSNENTCARTTISDRVKTPSLPKPIVVNEEDDKEEEVMDLSV